MITEGSFIDTTARYEHLKNHFPFFRICFSQATFPDGLDMPYMVLHFLNFLIEVGTLKGATVSRDKIDSYTEAYLEAVGYKGEYTAKQVSDILINSLESANTRGEAFEVTYTDPLAHKQIMHQLYPIAFEPRTRGYRITESGLDFMISTKELHDETRVTIGLIIFQKQIAANAFRNALQTVVNLNLEVLRKLEKKRMLLHQYMYGAYDIVRAYEKFAGDVIAQLQSEKTLFDEVQGTLATLSKDREELQAQSSKKITQDDYEVLRLIGLELERSVRNHTRLMEEFSRLSEQMDSIHHMKTRSLFTDKYHFEKALEGIVKRNLPSEAYQHMLTPLFMPYAPKSFNFFKIFEPQSMMRTDKEEKKKLEVKRFQDIKSMDELVEERLFNSYKTFSLVLINQLSVHPSFDLEFFLDALTESLGNEILCHVDLIPFLLDLNLVPDVMNRTKVIDVQAVVNADSSKLLRVQQALCYSVKRLGAENQFRMIKITSNDELVFLGPNFNGDTSISNMYFESE